MKIKNTQRTNVVYSTDPDWTPDTTETTEPVTAPAPKGVIRIELDRKQRAGKQVTVISHLPSQELEAVCRKLKSACATGGTVKNSTIELQGDQRKKASAQLTAQGYKVKVIGM